MATDVEDGPAGSPASPKELYNALYASCASQPEGKTFSQEELFALNVIPGNDMDQLMKCLAKLSEDKLFKLHTKDGKPVWKVVKRENAAKFKGLSYEEAMIYSYIESSGREGIWTRIIRTRTNLHQVVMNRCLKTLESKNRIKPIQSAKFPKRKIYILAELQPSDDVTGGPFYTDGMLDEEYVHQVGLWAEKYILARSWYHPPSKAVSKKKRKLEISAEEAEELRSQEFAGSSIGSSKVMLPLPPGYTGYPTIQEITRAVNESKISGIVLKEAEIRQLMDILVWDGRIMKVMGEKGYKAVRRGHEGDGSHIENGLTEAPCGRCPVFDLCEEGGPVNARTCTYFLDWLAP